MPRGPEKEIEQLKRRRQKAQDSGDIAEEAKICNNIGTLYAEAGDHRRALHYHRLELSLSEAGGDRLGAAIAHRKVGECECELANYDAAVQHQTEHLKIARGLGDLKEEQRALATLGRTYFVQSESQRGLEAEEMRVHAGNAHLKSLDVCDRLVGKVPDRELLQMKGRVYLNLGLVYQNQNDYRSARKFLEKALDIVKNESGEDSTVFRCHFNLGTLHLQEHHSALALRCFQQAVGVARRQGSGLNESEGLRGSARAYLQTSNFDAAKSCLKKVLQMSEGSQGETEDVERQLRNIRKILQYSVQVESVGVEKVEERLKLYEKLGDLCCNLAIFTSAVKFYGQQLRLAEAHGLEPRELSPILISLARSHSDCRQFSQALLYYQRELELWKGNPREECGTWISIACTRESAGESSGRVLEAYHKAAMLAREANCFQQEVRVHKSAVKYFSSQQEGGAELESERAKWEGQLSRLLGEHPETRDEISSDSDSSQQLSLDSDPPPSLPSTTSEEEEELEAVPRPHTERGVAVRRKRRVNRKNEKGETLLHVAAIEGNLTAVRQLVREGTEVNPRDNCGWLPLHEACNYGHLDVVRCLVDNGAAVNDRGGVHCGGVTPLLDAATNGFLEVVQLLVKKGADIQARDSQGRTVLAVLEERLSSDIRSESGQSQGYELADDHRAIRDFLWAESRRRGYQMEEVGGGSTTGARKSAQSGMTGRRRGHDRTGQSVLYSSDEEDISLQHSVTRRNSGLLRKADTSNPFKNFTVGSGSRHVRTSSRFSETQCGGSAMKFPAPQPPRGLPNPLGQVEVPALIPVEDEGVGSDGERGRVVDDWLIDDMGQPPAKRWRVEKSGVRHGSSGGDFPSMQRSKGRLSLGRKGKRSASAASGSGVKGGNIRREGSSSSVRSSGSSRRDDQSVVVPDSDSDDNIMGGDPWEKGFDSASAFGGSVAPRLDPGPPQAGLLSQTFPPSTTILHPAVEPPLRIRVQIEGCTYLIPCPRRTEGGEATSIRWLEEQASQRYYQQHGVRPQLSLTTTDGALLSTTDPIAHVLQNNEEVVGVAEQWLLPPLAERYQTACKNAGIACHPKTLCLFQSNDAPSSLDLSHLGLRPPHAGPTLQALQGCRALYSLSLAGNRLGGGATISSLAHMNTLHTLDLTCTGISTQCLASFFSCPPSSSASSPSPWLSLRRLSLSHNPLGPTCGPALGRLLSSCRGLRELGLKCCGLTAAVFDRHTGVSQALKALPSLAEIGLSRNPLEWEGLGALLQVIPTSARLTRLELAGTCPQGNFGKALRLPEVEGFFRECGGQLELLDLSHCGLEGGDLPSLVALLDNCGRLRELRLAGGGIGKEGVAQLCKWVFLSELRVMDLSGNPRLGADGCLELLKACKRLTRLGLASCGLCSPLPEDVLQAIGGWLAGGNTMLELAGNQIDRTDKLLIAPYRE